MNKTNIYLPDYQRGYEDGYKTAMNELAPLLTEIECIKSQVKIKVQSESEKIFAKDRFDISKPKLIHLEVTKHQYDLIMNAVIKMRSVNYDKYSALYNHLESQNLDLFQKIK